MTASQIQLRLIDCVNPAPVIDDLSHLEALSFRERAFVEHYIACDNASEAYVRAGYKDSDSARANASRLMKRETISHAITIEKRRASEVAGISIETILYEILQMGRDRGNPPAVRLTAYEMLLKHQSEKVSNTTAPGGPDVILSDGLQDV